MGGLKMSTEEQIDSDSEDRKKQIRQKAVALLAVRERSRYGLRTKLRELFDENEDRDLIESVLDFLEEKKYLSDERYAKSRITTRASRYGDSRLKFELKREHISEEAVEAAFEGLEETEYDRAFRIWERKFGETTKDPKEKARQFRFLASRGFSFKTIQRIVNGESDEDW